jgi:hypothetical protein
MIINIDVSHQPFVTSGNLVQIALAIVGERDPLQLARATTSGGRTSIELDRILKNCQIKANLGGNQFARRKIKKFGNVPANKQYFTQNGQELSVADYWFREHNTRLQHPELPCVQVSATACEFL